MKDLHLTQWIVTENQAIETDTCMTERDLGTRELVNGISLTVITVEGHPMKGVSSQIVMVERTLTAEISILIDR